MRWNTKDIVKALAAALADENIRLTVVLPGGDYDTEGVCIHRGSRTHPDLWVHGFNPARAMQSLQEAEDCDGITLVEVEDGMDSRGGLSMTNPTVVRVYGKVCTKLREMGFTVVPKMDDYF